MIYILLSLIVVVFLTEKYLKQVGLPHNLDVLCEFADNKINDTSLFKVMVKCEIKYNSEMWKDNLIFGCFSLFFFSESKRERFFLSIEHKEAHENREPSV